MTDENKIRDVIDAVTGVAKAVTPHSTGRIAASVNSNVRPLKQRQLDHTC